jgi:tRNA pseudouridine55 synthase
VEGFLNINKPAGVTSFSVVAAVKRLTGERHVGHAGTLDPVATGVLPVCLGQATRVIEFLVEATKVYRTQIELGVVTDTYDSDGKVLARRDITGVTREKVEAVLASFRGEIKQVPPMYSAIKHRGQPLYKMARSGIVIARPSRTVRIEKLELIAWEPPFVTLEVVCSKGTYIRSLAHDIGEALGCGANMYSLVRIRVGPFSIEEALTMPQIQEIARWGSWGRFLHPLDYVLMNYPALTVNKEQQCRLVNGAPIPAETPVEEPGIDARILYRAYGEDGSFLGVVRYDTVNQRWQPEKIFRRDLCE